MHPLQRWLGHQRLLIVVVVVAAALSGCTQGGRPSRTHDATPLPTGATAGALLCGFVSRQAVITALGRSDITATGGAETARSRNPDGTSLARAHCTVDIPHGGQAPAYSVDVTPFSLPNGGLIVRNVVAGDYPVTYPSNVGIGFCDEDSYTDGNGKSHPSCNSGLVRGDWTITSGVQVPGPGRNAVGDTMAITQQIVTQLKLPLRPSRPYPAGLTATTASP